MATSDADPEVPPSLRPPAEADPDAAARGALYGLLATALDEPDRERYAAIESGEFREWVVALVDRTALDVDVPGLTTDDDHDTLCARFNSLFTLGHAEYADRSDGSLDAEGPPVPLYESPYRDDVSWNDVNLDLARAYDYFGLAVDQDRREHHDHVPLLLEFAGYLARREAASDGTDAAAARLDFHDRHLRVAAEGVAEAMAAEPGTGFYGDVVTLFDDLSAADRADLADRLDEGGVD